MKLVLVSFTLFYSATSVPHFAFLHVTLLWVPFSSPGLFHMHPILRTFRLLYSHTSNPCLFSYSNRVDTLSLLLYFRLQLAAIQHLMAVKFIKLAINRVIDTAVLKQVNNVAMWTHLHVK